MSPKSHLGLIVPTSFDDGVHEAPRCSNGALYYVRIAPHVLPHSLSIEACYSMSYRLSSDPTPPQTRRLSSLIPFRYVQTVRCGFFRRLWKRRPLRHQKKNGR